MMSSLVSHMSPSSENLIIHCVSLLNQILNCTKFLVFIIATLKRLVNIDFPSGFQLLPSTRSLTSHRGQRTHRTWGIPSRSIPILAGSSGACRPPRTSRYVHFVGQFRETFKQMSIQLSHF